MPLSYWTRRKYTHLRCLMRGNAWCKRNGGFSSIRRLQNDLIAVALGANAGGAKWFYGTAAPIAELVARQFVFDRYGGGKLNRVLLEQLGSGASIDAGMPYTWRNYFSNKGWPVSRLASYCKWQIIIGLRFLQGVLYVCTLFVKLAIAKKVVSVPAAYAYFEGLGPANLPTQCDLEFNYDICNFYAKWHGRSQKILEICHDVPNTIESVANGLRIRYRPPAYELAGGLGSALKLAWWGVWATMFAAFQMLFGRWYWALLLGEAAKAKAVRLVPDGKLAAEYLFHVSRNIYRPMWTYEVEKAGAAVAVYFYATYVQPKLASGYEAQDFEWGPNTWPRFLVWDRYQEEMIRRSLGDTVEILRAGPIYFSDNGKPPPPLPPNSIAVFDIQPHRPSLHFGISTMADCLARHPDFYHRFLRDVTDVLSECGAVAVLKTKREINARGDRKYGQILRRLATSEGTCIVDPGLSAIRIAKNCRAGISAPFTSTAIHVQTLGLPSIYYDPVGWIQADDSGAHGIPILYGKAALRAWVVSVLSRPVEDR